MSSTAICGRHRGSEAGCTDCRRLSVKYDRRRRKAIDAGTWLPRVDPGPAVAHVAWLRENGLSLNAIGRACGVSPKTIQELPERKFLHGPTAAALLAVRPDVELPARNMRPAIGSARRVQALAAIGWSFTEQGRRLGMSTQQVWQLAWPKSQLVTVATADRVHDLFERLSATPGPSVRARNAAVKHGWPPPLAWDDLDADPATPNPAPLDDAIVDEVAVARALRGERLRLSHAEEAAFIRSAVDAGDSLTAAAGRLGVSKKTAEELLAVGTSKARAKRDRVDAVVAEFGAVLSTKALARRLGVHEQTVLRSRRRLAERQQQIAS